MNSLDVNTCKYQSTSSAYHNGTLPWLKMDHFARLVLLSGLQSAPNMALAQSLMPDLEDSPAPGGVRWAGENSTSRKNLCFFFFNGLPACPFLSQGPWTHIHESMIIRVCLAFACCHALVVWPLHALCCSIQQGGSSRICRLQRKTRRLRQVGVSVMCWSQLLFHVLYTSSWNCCMAAWIEAELVDMLRCSGRGAWKLIQEELAAFSMKDMKAAHILNESTRQSNSHPDAMGTPWDTKKTWSHDMVPRNVSLGW